MSDAAEKGREVNKTAVVAMAAEVIATIAGSCMASGPMEGKTGVK